MTFADRSLLIVVDFYEPHFVYCTNSNMQSVAHGLQYLVVINTFKLNERMLERAAAHLQQLDDLNFGALISYPVASKIFEKR